MFVSHNPVSAMLTPGAPRYQGRHTSLPHFTFLTPSGNVNQVIAHGLASLVRKRPRLSLACRSSVLVPLTPHPPPARLPPAIADWVRSDHPEVTQSQDWLAQDAPSSLHSLIWEMRTESRGQWKVDSHEKGGQGRCRKQEEMGRHAKASGDQGAPKARERWRATGPLLDRRHEGSWSPWVGTLGPQRPSGFRPRHPGRGMPPIPKRPRPPRCTIMNPPHVSQRMARWTSRVPKAVK